MAERRMFARSIVLSDAFLDMPATARCLYFTLSMFADDDGFVGSPKAIIRQCNASEDDLKVLLTKRYVLLFNSGVIVIKHWRINNYLRNDRKNDTTYKEELSTLALDQKGGYIEKGAAPPPPVLEEVSKDAELQVPTSCLPTANQLPTNCPHSIGKDSIVKNSIGKRGAAPPPPTLEEVRAYVEAMHYSFSADDFFEYYASQKWKKANGQPLCDWKMGCSQWERREKKAKGLKDKARGKGGEIDVRF